MKNNVICKIIILLSMFYCGELQNTVLAHEGHAHSHDTKQVTIGRQTYTYFKTIISVYHEVYDSVSGEQLSPIPLLAQKLIDAAGKGIETESKNPGRNMMKSVLNGAQRLKQADGLQEAQEAFASISDAIMPFFKSWPNQLKQNKMKLYQCKAHGHYWLQPAEGLPVCPYVYNKTTKCSIIALDVQ